MATNKDTENSTPSAPTPADNDIAKLTEVTEQDLAEAIIDEYGAKYSKDGKRLLKGPCYASFYNIKKGTEIIGNSAFSRCKSLTSITIPPSVTAIGDSAFNGCTRLSRIYCYAQNPPEFEFESILKGRPTLYVPRESLERYKQVCSAGRFADICPINYYLSYYVDGKLYSRELLDIGTHITPLAEPEKEGHTFSGWEDPIPDVMPTYDVAVGGRFKVNTYKVTYMVGGEVVHVDNVAYGSPIPAYVYSPEDEAVVFRGWIGERYEKMPAFDVVYTADIANGIDDIVQDREMDVYDLTGMKVGTTSEWHTLKPGTYIVNGRKVRKR